VAGVERWAELRREHFLRGVSIKKLGGGRVVADHGEFGSCCFGGVKG
jgi:hypothetical protein